MTTAKHVGPLPDYDDKFTLTPITLYYTCL